MRLRTVLFLICVTLPLAAESRVPRMGGHPDLSGVWRAERPSLDEAARLLGAEFTNLQVDLNDAGRQYIDIFWGVKPEDEPLTAQAKAVMKQRATQPPPMTRCLPAGTPGSLFVYAFKMIQTPHQIVLLSETGDTPRQMYFDGRSLPADPQPSWSGSSVAKWQGDTLVVETTGFTEESWLDGFGHPRSEKMRIRESYHRRDFGHMDLDVQIEDPKYYTRPFGFKAVLDLIPNGDLLEYVCAENEKDRAHMVRQ